MKKCPGCGQMKALGEYRIDRNKPRGVSFRCRECMQARDRERYANNDKVRKQAKEAGHKHYVKNREATLTRCKARRDAIGNRKIWLERMYGITSEDYDRMYSEQDGTCPICKTRHERGKLVVDHNHETGEIRGLLCHKCNLLAGHIENNLDKMYDLFLWIGL